MRTFMYERCAPEIHIHVHVHIHIMGLQQVKNQVSMRR